MLATPAYDHIIVVVEENHGYDAVIGNTAQAPFINSLAAKGTRLTNFQAEAHPSQPNYYALYAGSTFGTADDKRRSEPDPTLATVLHAAGRTFRGYVDEADVRDFNHEPWSSFPEGTSVETPFTMFPALFPKGDYGNLPSVAFVIPGLRHDMHDGTIRQADDWLRVNIWDYAHWAPDHNSLLVIVGDENEGARPNRVPAILYGAHVAAGVNATRYNHFNLLRTILANFGLEAPNEAAAARVIDTFEASSAPGASTGADKP